jgi:predicted CoA-substrate-specific enzyme activase
MPVGGDPEGAVTISIENALKALKIKKKELQNIVLTGRNSDNISLKKEKESELRSLAMGAHALAPNVRTIINTGSFTNKVVRIDPKGQIVDYMTNDKCAAGAGMFLELVGKSLDLSITDFGTIALSAQKPVPITSQCSIFAESEVIYLMNDGASVPDIAAGACISVVGRLIPLVAKVGVEKEVILTGGVGKNPMVVQALEKQLGITLAHFELDPQYVGAFGAAIIAAGNAP